MHIVIYVQNHCPHRVLGMSAPEEAFTGTKPNFSHIKIFGSYVYVHVTKNVGKKLEPTAKVGIFAGYTKTPHIYHVYFPNSRITRLRWDIKFKEEKAMKLLLERELDLHA